MLVFHELIGATHTKIDSLSNRFISIFGDGTERKGYIEKARDEDKQWQDKMEDGINPVLRWVAAQQVLAESDKEAAKKRTERMKIWIPIVAAVVIGLLTWFIPKVWAVGSFLWDDYLKAHPNTSLRQLTESGYMASSNSAFDPYVGEVR